MEHILAVLLVCFLVALFISQALLLVPGLRQRIVKVERLEGHPYMNTAGS
ncbi:hypothetical protein WMW72_05810 [Paenibacillus filicis]|uniref:Uncharacterized protein n=1 Tax=Paenibacillus filicis TaxID=669464 RepID=A0ABU9DGM7_9BACL